MLQLPTRLAAIGSVVFAAICLWFGFDGLNSVSADPAEAAGERQFAWFWLFLGVSSLGMGWLTWMIALKKEREVG